MAVLKRRKNVARLTDDEKAKFRDAVFRLRELGRYDKYVRMHEFVSDLGHSGPAFFPWHRVFVHKFEEELQQIDPDVTVPYWEWTSDNLDSGGNSLIWRDDFLGRNGNVTLTWTGQDGTTKTWTIRRRNFNVTSSPGDNGLSSALAQNDYRNFRPALEFAVHGGAHGWLGIPGDQASFTTAVNDPWFFLLHCNVDRLWMEWQQRKRAQWLAANPGMEYPQSQLAVDYFYDKSDPAHTWTSPPNRHNLDDVFWPWDGTQTLTGGPNSAFSPWKDGMPEIYTPRAVLNHHNFGYSYDTEPPPKISDVRYEGGADRGVIDWITDIPATSQVEYGETPQRTGRTPLNPNLVTFHTVVLRGLTSNRRYFYRVRSESATGALGTSEGSFFQPELPP